MKMKLTSGPLARTTDGGHGDFLNQTLDLVSGKLRGLADGRIN